MRTKKLIFTIVAAAIPITAMCHSTNPSSISAHAKALKHTKAKTRDANTHHSVNNGPDHFLHAFQITLTGGAGFSELKNNPTVNLNNIITNTYETQSTTTGNAIAGIGAHYLFNWGHDTHVAIGPAFYYIDFGKVNGIESPFSNVGRFDTLDYQFFNQSFDLFLESTVSCRFHQFRPFFLVGIGAAWNELYNYSEIPTDPSRSASSAITTFGNNTKTQFAYELGIGFSHLLYSDTKRQVIYNFSLQYRYMNTGSGELKPSALQTTNDKLQVSTLDTQAVLLAISAIFH